MARRRVHAQRPSVATLAFVACYHETAVMPVEDLRRIAREVRAPEKRIRGGQAALHVWLLEHWRRPRLRSVLVAAVCARHLTEGVAVVQAVDARAAVRACLTGFVAAEAAGDPLSWCVTLLPAVLRDDGGALSGRLLRNAEVQAVIRRYVRSRAWGEAIAYYRGVRRRDTVLEKHEVASVIEERELAAKAAESESRAAKAEADIAALYAEAIAAIDELERDLAAERARHAGVERNLLLALRHAGVGEEALAAAEAQVPAETTALQGRRVLVVGDPGRFASYRDVLAWFGADSAEVECFDGMASDPVRVGERAAGADFVVVIAGYVRHRVSGQALRAAGERAVLVPVAGVRQFERALRRKILGESSTGES